MGKETTGVEVCEPHSGGATATDIYRDTWVRYLGYANELGESFRSFLHVRAVHATYGVAFAYAAADSVRQTEPRPYVQAR
jgi:fission process protein 1